MFTVDLDTIKIDCDPYPMCARLRRDKRGKSSLNPVVEQAILNSPEVENICQAYINDASDFEGGSEEC
jgi:hypothetical protein